MERTIQATSDGSKTLFINALNEGYHSHHGALQEAIHVFINNGLKLINNCEINILELGFGTGLNVLVTIDEFLKKNSTKKIHYISMEKYPISSSEIEELRYFELFDTENSQEIYQKIHSCNWDEAVEILPNFYLTKIKDDFFNLKNKELPAINLVYFDCFGARVQPDLWEKPLFEIISGKMAEQGLLTTYSSKGSVRRILQELHFIVEKKEGPKGKREMMIAWKGGKMDVGSWNKFS